MRYQHPSRGSGLPVALAWIQVTGIFTMIQAYFAFVDVGRTLVAQWEKLTRLRGFRGEVQRLSGSG